MDEFGVAQKTAYNYLNRARSLAVQCPEQTASELRKIHVNMRLKLLQEAEHIRDKLEIEKDIARIQGLYEEKVLIEHRKAEDLEDDKLIELVIQEGGTHT